jgi:hypothetical protein
MACALITMAALSHNGEGLAPRPDQIAIFSNTDHTISKIDSERSVQNHLAAVTFDWTNRSVFKSSISFTPSTNLSN